MPLYEQLKINEQRGIKMETIKYYSNTNRYLGWMKFGKASEQFLDLKDWILHSGNYIKHKCVKINTISELLKLYKK